MPADLASLIDPPGAGHRLIDPHSLTGGFATPFVEAFRPPSSPTLQAAE